MSQTLDQPATTQADDRTQRRSLVRRLIARPEIGSVIGAIVIFLFFLAVAPPFRGISAQTTVLYASSTIGLMAVAVALLMIGGEFDLSAGVSVTTAALTASMFAFQMRANVWVGVLVALLVALAIGFFNGWLVIKTRIPSFLVTLGSFLMLQGLNLAVTRMLTGVVATPSISDMEGFPEAETVFATVLQLGTVRLRITVVYWLLFVALATWVLLRTRVGNWIFAAGGDADAARAVGVPVKRVKIGLFMTVGFMAWFTGMHLLFTFNSIQSGEGVGNEFLYIIAAVIGGNLLTGGYGSAVGSAVGAFIFGMATQGIVFAGWEADWFFFFLGVMLLLATIANTWVREAAR
jgi:simple sugar transport system permease protein